MAAVDPGVNTSANDSLSSWATLPPKEISVNATDTCACHHDGTRRTCFECLNVKLQSGEECLINPLGECVSAKVLARERSALPSVGAIPHDDRFYSSSTHTYCGVTDSVCSNARGVWAMTYNSSAGGSNGDFYRVGTADCICTAYCDFRQYDINNITLGSQYTLGDAACVAASPKSWSDEEADVTFARMNLAKNIALLLCAFVMAVVLVRHSVLHFHQYRYDQRMRERRRVQREQRNQATASHFGPRMALEGWNAYREQLVDDEQRKLGLAREERALTNAPSHTEPEIQIGEGFRPTSPSQLRRQQQSSAVED